MRKRDTLLYIYVPALFCYTSRYITNSTLPLFLVRENNLSKSVTGLLIASIALGRFIGDVPSGVLMDRYGSKFLISSYLLMSLSSSLCAALTTFSTLAYSTLLPILAVGLFLEGLGMAASVVAWQTLTATVVAESQRSTVSAAIGGINRLGAVIAPLLGGVIYQVSSMKYVFVLQALFPILCIILIFATRTEDDRLLNRNTASESIIAILCTNYRSILVVLPFITGLQIIRETRKLAIPLLANNFHWSPSLISGLLSFSYVFDVLLFPLAAWLYRRYGVRRAAVIGVATFSVGLAVLAAGATEPVALWMGAAVAGVANGASSGIVVALGVEISPEISSSSFSGIFRAICDFGEILGPIVCGLLLDRTNNVYWAFLCVCGIAWLGLAILVAAPNQKPQAMTGATTPAAKELPKFAGNIECTVDK